MNKLFISPLIVILSYIQIPAQWNVIHNFQQKDFYSIDFIAEHSGFLGGEALFAKTTNGGKSWLSINKIDGNDVLSMIFLNENEGVAVGRRYWDGPGYIYYTTDGGFNWHLGYYLPYAYAAVNDVFVLDNNHGWAVGEDGNIFKIISGIDDWDYVTSLPVDLNAVYFINQNIGWTVGWGKLYKSTNGGNSWIEKPTGLNTKFYDVFFLDQNIGWIVAQPSNLLSTSDGGETWTVTPLNTTLPLQIRFLSDSLGYISSNSKFIKTTDGGSTWNTISIPGASWFTGMDFTNQQTGYLAGWYSKLFKTTNSGESWKEMMLAEFNNLNSIDMYSTTRGVAVGDSGTILKKNNDSWLSGITNTLQNLHSVYTFNQTTAIAVGDSGVILKSTDYYLNWTEKNSGINVNLNSVQFANNYVGWIVGDNGTLLKSTDTGETWTIVNSGLSENFNSIHFINTSTGWICGNNGLIMKTADGGLNWYQQNSNLVSNILKIEFCNPDTGFALAKNGIILRSNDGGNNWNTIYDDPYYELYDVSFVNTRRGWTCGQYGYIYRTTDGGFSWTPQFNSPYIGLKSVCILDSNIVFTAGDDGVIVLTTNGGQGPPVPVELIAFTALSNGNEVVLNWSTATELNNQMFEMQRKSGSEEFFTIGYQKGHGTTTEPQNYTYTDKNLERNKYFYRLKQLDYLGTYQYSEEIEVDVAGVITFSLSQNYPNPFNPRTVISYQLPVSGLVTLKVYDILGNEIATLVNEEKQPGTYEVNFNTSSIKHLPSSGIYFYQLRAGAFVETKKMVIMK